MYIFPSSLLVIAFFFLFMLLTTIRFKASGAKSLDSVCRWLFINLIKNLCSMLDNLPLERSSNLWLNIFPFFSESEIQSDDCCYLEEHAALSTVLKGTVHRQPPWNFTHCTYLLHRFVHSAIFFKPQKHFGVLWRERIFTRNQRAQCEPDKRNVSASCVCGVIQMSWKRRKFSLSLEGDAATAYQDNVVIYVSFEF